VDLESRFDEYFILKATKTRGEYVICNPTGFRAGLYGNTVPSHER
jgi:hypothetical protein